MRMKLRLLNASSELLFSVDVGNLPETYGADSIKRVTLLYVIKDWKGDPSNQLSIMTHSKPENRY